MIIEFAGISGSGKSTVLRKLLKALHQDGVPLTHFNRCAKTDPLTKSQATRQFEARYPGLQAAFETTAEGAPFMLRHMPRAIRVWMCGLRKLAPGELGFIDEGFMHRAAYLAASGGGAPAFDALLAQLPKPDVIVLCRVSMKTAETRFVTRQDEPEVQERLRGLFHQHAEIHAGAAALCETGVEDMRKHGVKTIVVDNEKDLTTVLADLRQEMIALHDSLDAAA